ncbi:MAG: class II aldolase/adducin family protein [Lentisphaeria bacterium]|nr:class II aldolase/adducin family protein [Lentisphaeria bacterium]
MNDTYLHPRVILVSTLKRLYDFGMTTTSGGNLSIKDDDGNIWITPSGIDKGTLRPEDVIMVTPDGKEIGPHKPSCELPFHRSVYNLRPDVRAVLHAHSPALVAFSLVGRMPNTQLVPEVAAQCGKVAFAGYEVPGSEKLGKIIAAEFAAGASSVIMENHGAVVCGTSIAQAFSRFEALDYMARMEINSSDISTLNDLTTVPAADCAGAFEPETVSPEECALRESLVQFSSRCYRQGLVFSGAGVLSARLTANADDFLVTPAGFDPLLLTADELVRVYNNKAQAGRTPSALTAICRAIYQAHPEVNAIMITRPPYFMAYASAGLVMDSRTIPESYIQLRDIPLLKGADAASPEVIAGSIAPVNPVLMLENGGILTTGATLINAFDRLEVGEFTAKCLILANRIGKPNPIAQPQVDEIIDVFGLPR